MLSRLLSSVQPPAISLPRRSISFVAAAWVIGLLMGCNNSSAPSPAEIKMIQRSIAENGSADVLEGFAEHFGTQTPTQRFNSYFYPRED